jgi:hypothetical protein
MFPDSSRYCCQTGLFFETGLDFGFEKRIKSGSQFFC